MESLETKQVKRTRKEHKCWGCMKIFPVGSEMDVWRNIIDGSIESTHVCKACAKIAYDNFSANDELEQGFAI